MKLKWVLCVTRVLVRCATRDWYCWWNFYWQCGY